MASKKKVEKEAASWVGGIEKYSRQIWLAGLGAYAKISTDGNKLFDSLVKEGESAEKQARGEMDKQVDTVKATTRSKVGGVKDKALGKWGELEEAFDKRLNSAISRLGVPSRNEVAALNEKVDLLMRELERLTGATVPQAQAALQAPDDLVTKPLASATRRANASKPSTAKASKPAGSATSTKAAAKTTLNKASKTGAKAVGEAASTAKAATTAEKKPRTRKPAAKASAASTANSATPASSPATAPAAEPATPA